jgi:membrane protein DedA with SNARE-associated domain
MIQRCGNAKIDGLFGPVIFVWFSVLGAILIGIFLEGETTMILVGLAAHQGYLMLIWVILAAFPGSLYRRHIRF